MQSQQMKKKKEGLFKHNHIALKETLEALIDASRRTQNSSLLRIIRIALFESTFFLAVFAKVLSVKQQNRLLSG